jgi:hypothetical protein
MSEIINSVEQPTTLEEIWRYLEKIRGDEAAFKKLFVGKYNPTDPDHQRLIEAATWLD